MHVSKDGRTFALYKPELSALARVMSRDPGRPSLNALWLDRKHRRAWSSDGHRILIGTADGGDFKKEGAPDGIRAASVAAMLKGAASKDLIVFHIEKQSIGCKVFDGSNGAKRSENGLPCTEKVAAAFPVLTASAPPVASIIPGYEERPPKPSPFIAMNPKWLAGLADLTKIGGDKTIPVVWYHAGELDPALAVFRCDDGAVWRSVIMPMRLDEKK